MPILEFTCHDCRQGFERIVLTQIIPSFVCPLCHNQSWVERKMSVPGVIRMGHHKALSIDELQPGEKGGPRCLR